MAEAAISLMLSLIVIITIYVCVFTDISHGRGRHQPELSLIVIYTIHVCVFTDISHGRGRHQPEVIINCN